MVLVIDNYDSFTYNLVQYLYQIGEQVVVLRNDEVTLEQIDDTQPDSILLSPGPGNPDEAGICLDVIRHVAGRIPILGVCLGHQAIAQAFGAKVLRASQPMHGKTSLIHHQGQGVFAGLESPYRVTRYHSLVVERETLPACLEITAETETGEIMALRHKSLPIEGVQFHPESILTEHGHALLRRFFETNRLVSINT
ncbi:anthranilate synthase component II [Brevibacillus dissolubilis]|uniref:anthranilate synthase component II n=1 Tax=Brevibacillus dissolubilis TaxID=1844116 RepID=UPI0011167F96|nr:aminodeoxychorismate/anthranilate synthase component II [Brevibacillus dissolubilis]